MIKVTVKCSKSVVQESSFYKNDYFIDQPWIQNLIIKGTDKGWDFILRNQVYGRMWRLRELSCRV